MRIDWLVEAVADLENIIDHAASVDRAMARNIADRIELAEATILTFPRSGRYDAETDTFEKYVPRTRVILVYRLTEAAIVIIGAFHTSRDPATKPGSRLVLQDLSRCR